MVALQIRDVPEEVRDALAGRARARGQSLQAFLLALVQEEARRSRNLALLDRFTGRTDGSKLTIAEAGDSLARARAQRDEQLIGRPGRVAGGAA
jgi:plasmid stability protein